ncbi:hypothetical protein [uncultured Erythrobacter sp.]|nr:hypothetical protein [uncultured Erythrobacter sp.]
MGPDTRRNRSIFAEKAKLTLLQPETLFKQGVQVAIGPHWQMMAE